jgi:hypothetical protein
VASITYADEIDPYFGIPWPEGQLRYDKGNLVCALSDYEVDELTERDPAQAETLTRLLLDQPKAEKDDPIAWGWTLPSWRRVMETWGDTKLHVILGGNRSSKSCFASRMLMHMAMQIPEAELRSMHVSEERSISDAQKYLHAALPMRYKRGSKKSVNHSLLYSQKNGYSDNKMILPPSDDTVERGSTVYFNNYRQYMADAQIFEGWNAHCIACDEEISEDIFNTLLARLTDFHGRLILTFTTLQGWTPLINTLLKGAEVVEKRYSKLIGRDLPVEQISANWPDCRIYNWWSSDSPFIDSGELVRTYSKQSLEVKLARLFGIPSKSFHGRFPKFNREVNVIPHDQIPFIKDPTLRVTRYFACDPGGSKPWVAIWAAVLDTGHVYVYREFPDQTMGAWALPHVNGAGRSTGKPGPGQKPLGWGYADYSTYFKDQEQGEEIFERIVDPRMGAATVRTKEGTSNIINSMTDLGFVFRAAPGQEIESGCAAINDLLSWDEAEPLTEKNCPKLYVSDQCDNTITSLMEYTGTGGSAEHFKDYPDCIRYLVTSGAEYVTHNMLQTTGGGGY